MYNLRKPLGIYVEFFEYLRLLSFLKGFLFEHLVKKQLYSFMKSDNQWTLNGSQKDSQMCFQGYSLIPRCIEIYSEIQNLRLSTQDSGFVFFSGLILPDQSSGFFVAL